MSNSLLTDGWALPVSIWDRALALIPRRLAISRSPTPGPGARPEQAPGRGRRGRAGCPARSSPVAVMPGSVQSGAYCSAPLDTRYAPPDTGCSSSRRSSNGRPAPAAWRHRPDHRPRPRRPAEGRRPHRGGHDRPGRPQIDADAEVVDASGKIVIPGFVDTHRHTWEAAIRGCAPNATLGTYFVEVLDSFAPTTGPRTSTPATWPGRWSASTPASRPWSTGRTSTTPPSTPTPASAGSRRPASGPSTPTAAPTPR